MANKITTVSSTTTSPEGQGVPLPQTILDVYSKEISFKAQPLLRIAQVARQRTELNTAAGLTIKMLKYNSLTGGYHLHDEVVPIETENMSAGFVEITVGERGKAVSVSNLQLLSSYTNVLDDATTLLGMHYAFNRDREARDTLYQMPNVLYPNGKTSRADLVSADTLSVAFIDDITERLAVNKVPMFDGDGYICFVHPSQSKTLRRDPEWRDIAKYANQVSFFTGEIGRINRIRFVETTMIRQIKKATGAQFTDSVSEGVNATVYSPTADVFQGIVVGDYCLGEAVGLDVELREDGITDFGRIRKLAYYTVRGFGLLEPTHGLIIETAA